MKVPDTNENSQKCICGDCPSYIDGKDEGFFCSMGKSAEKYEKNGCICGRCDLWEDYKLTKGYFCISGEAQ